MYILLQHLADKPSITQITETASPFTTVLIAVLSSAAASLGTYLVNRNITKPNEKVEQYEAAEIKALRDALGEFKANHRDEKSEWQIWRDQTTRDIAQLQFQQKAIADFLSELKMDLKNMKTDIQLTRDTVTGVKTAVDQTLARYLK